LKENSGQNFQTGERVAVNFHQLETPKITINPVAKKVVLSYVFQEQSFPIPFMYGIFTYIYYKKQQNAGKYTI